MHAGAPTSYWIGFHLLVLALLLVDLVLPSSGQNRISLPVAWSWTAFLTFLASVFAFFVFYTQGHQAALEFASGYLIETSLSVDNLFVFLLLFRAFKLNAAQQHRALLLGIFGAIVMRAAFILAGVSLLARFEWIQYIFGAFLLYAAVKLLRQDPANSEPSGFVKWALRQSASPSGKTGLRSFVLIIMAVELTDLVFALDSIPAVLAITRNPFVAYTSNIFSILGLRALFFALSGLLDRFHLLHYGLAAILAFVALKMLLAHFVFIPVTISLAVIIGILGISIVLSLKKPAHPVS